MAGYRTSIESNRAWDDGGQRRIDATDGRVPVGRMSLSTAIAKRQSDDDRICVCESRELRHSQDSPWRSARPTGGNKEVARRQPSNLAAVETGVGELVMVGLVVGALGPIA